MAFKFRQNGDNFLILKKGRPAGEYIDFYNYLLTFSRLLRSSSSNVIELPDSAFYYSKDKLLDFLDKYASFLKLMLNLDYTQYAICVFGP